MAKANGFQNFAHPERRHLLDFQKLTNDRKAAKNYYSQGRQLDLENKLDEAITAYCKAIELDSQHALVYLALGNIFAKCDQVDKAIAYSQQASGLYGWKLCGEKDYQFIDNWFSEHIPVWEKYLIKSLAHKPDLRGLEIGSYQGMSTCWLLDNILTHASSRLVCIDPFYSPYGEQFDNNIIRSGAASKVTKISNLSQEALLLLKPLNYDFVYIDGDHHDDVVLQDAVLSWNLVKVGGLMIFDDYKAPSEQNTKIGTDKFLLLFSSSVEILYEGYQIIIRKTSNDLNLKALSNYRDVLTQEILKSLTFL